MPTAQTTPRDIAPILEPILKKSKLPAIAGGVLVGDKVAGLGAVGVRKFGDPTPVTAEDKFHIGSCTKMMTATLAAILVEEGMLKWDSTIGDVIGDRIGTIHPDFEPVTLEQLLAHVGGLRKSPPRKLWREAWENQGELKPSEQRMVFVSALLARKPGYRPGGKMVYSNQGYSVVGVMLETVAGASWEDLLKERIFVPLDMSSAGFRAPMGKGEIDQPWGHSGKKPVSPVSVESDNPDAIGPAGAVHLSMEDLLKFARFYLRREPGALLKKEESFEKLNSTLPNSRAQGVGGWLVHDIKTFGGHCLQMIGSNTVWFTIFWIFPGFDMAIVVSANSAPFSAFFTCDKAVADLLEEFKP
ncbi:MAG: serine hydrolase [Verrucomicrobiales bacterium]|nr:serine hydrolase [Verrucomicrobiales bacterium]